MLQTDRVKVTGADFYEGADADTDDADIYTSADFDTDAEANTDADVDFDIIAYTPKPMSTFMLIVMLQRKCRS